MNKQDCKNITFVITNHIILKPASFLRREGVEYYLSGSNHRNRQWSERKAHPRRSRDQKRPAIFYNGRLSF